MLCPNAHCPQAGFSQRVSGITKRRSIGQLSSVFCHFAAREQLHSPSWPRTDKLVRSSCLMVVSVGRVFVAIAQSTNIAGPSHGLRCLSRQVQALVTLGPETTSSWAAAFRVGAFSIASRTVHLLRLAGRRFDRGPPHSSSSFLISSLAASTQSCT